jgi:hypothetical protein
MAGPRLLDTKITTKTHNRAERIDMRGPKARPGAWPAEPSCGCCRAGQTFELVVNRPGRVAVTHVGNHRQSGVTVRNAGLADGGSGAS